eukprot:CAMPEP_0175123116 /NCGR_PEP_ID=MMETSP0087-20121206/2072_1 /TAXON_ID=136419 /ORGANISM="Unknown Unknown, Strain D1" /LENGTH=132 /DNA_ID=CAMNT_0016404787 /DNA_START=144 /DNA_END=542 /DNA_ORIENTATION=-
MPGGVAFKVEHAQVCKKDSQQIDDKDRAAIVELVRNHDGHVLITHGTDTMVETGLALKSAGVAQRRAVVITGALHPETFKDTDAHFNIGTAVGALNLLHSGVFIAMSGRIYDVSAVKRDPLTGQFVSSSSKL